jgi:hypothetical protein
MDILEKLKILASGETYINTPELSHYAVTEEAIAEIENLRQQVSWLSHPENTRNMMTRYIGDVHGNMDQYQRLIRGIPKSVQVGDFGAGFVKIPELPINHRFIRGNHDNPDICRNHPNCIVDGSFDGDTLYIGGAWSIDQQWRTPGVSWWYDEELSIIEFEEIITTAATYQPRKIVSHDCPMSVVSELFGLIPRSTRTQQALDTVFDVCKPEVWIFGHWHTSISQVIKGTRFICLDELEYVDL